VSKDPCLKCRESPDLAVTIRSVAGSIGVNKVVLALSMARMGDAIGNSILYIIIPLYVASLPAPFLPFSEPVRTGFLIALYGLVTALFQPIAGAMSDRLCRRKLFIQAGLVILAGSTLLFVLANTFTDLLILRTLQGFGVALDIPALLAIMTVATKKETMGGSMGVFTTARMAGFAIGPLIGGFLYEIYGFDVPFFVATGFVILAIILVQAWVKEVPCEIPPEGKGVAVLFNRSLLTAGIVGLAFATFTMASAFSMMTTLEPQINERLHQSAFAFGIAFSSLTIALLIAQIPLGRLSDRIGRKPLIAVGLVIIAPFTALIGFVTSTAQLVAVRVIMGVASAGIAAPGFALAGDIAKKGSEAQQLAIVTMGFGLGIAVGPLIAGFLVSTFFALPFIIGGLMALAGAIVVWRFVPETIARDPPRKPEG
jgi:MFS family permease